MIKLTRANGRDVWVEPSAIVMVETDGMKTTVTLAHGTMLLVKEDVQHVLAERLKAHAGLSLGREVDPLETQELVKQIEALDAEAAEWKGKGYAPISKMVRSGFVK